MFKNCQQPSQSFHSLLFPLLLNSKSLQLSSKGFAKWHKIQENFGNEIPCDRVRRCFIIGTWSSWDEAESMEATWELVIGFRQLRIRLDIYNSLWQGAKLKQRKIHTIFGSANHQMTDVRVKVCVFVAVWLKCHRVFFSICWLNSFRMVILSCGAPALPKEPVKRIEQR